MEPFAREILDRAQRAHDPTAADRARVRAKLARRIGAGVFLAGGTAKASTMWISIAKLAVPMFVVSAVVVAFVTHKSSNVAPATTEKTVVQTEVAPTAPPLPTAPLATPLTATAEAPALVASIATPVPLVAHAHPLAAPASSADLEAETLLLAAAQSAIQRGDFDAALAKLGEHEKTFPNGVLVEERIATRVVAMCGAGRTEEARVLGKTFLARYPRSPLAPRVKSSCAAP